MTDSPAPLKQIRPLAFILNVRMTILATDLSAFLTAIKPPYDAVIREPECAFFNLGVVEPFDPLTGGKSGDGGNGEVVVSFSEGWNCSLEWFSNVQLKKEYYNEYREITVPMYRKPRKSSFDAPDLASSSPSYPPSLWLAACNQNGLLNREPEPN